MNRLLPIFITLAHSAVVEYKWTVSQFKASFDGFERLVTGVNNQPGHLNRIEANSGDTIRVILTNGLLEPTSIHWHGIHQRNTQTMDGPVGTTQCPIPPGHTYTYEFKTDNLSGTF